MTTRALSLAGIHSAPVPVEATSQDRVASVWGWGLLVAMLGVSAAGVQNGFVWWLAVMAIMGFVCAVIGLVRPAIGLIGISLLCTLDPIMRHFLLDAGVQYLRFNTLNYWLLIVMLCHQRVLRRLRDMHSRLIVGFVAFLMLELVFSERVSRGAQHVLGILTLFGLLVYFVRAAASRRAWYWQGVSSGTAGAMGGLLYLAQFEDIPKLNHNVYALFPETAIFAVCLAIGFAADKREEFVLVGLAAINLVWVFLSGSRGGMLIGAVGLVFLLTAVRGSGKKMLYIASAVAVAMMLSGWFADRQNAAVMRFEKLWSPDETSDGRTSGRTSLALGGWYIFLNHPLGVGTGGSELAWAKLGYVEGVSSLKAGEEFSLHSGWVKVLAENGLPGILFFIAVVASFAVVGWRSGDPFLRLLGCSVTLTLAIAFLSTEFQGKAFWFLAAGALTLLNRRAMLMALTGGRRRSVWWVRPGMPAHALRPKVVGAEEDAGPPAAKLVRRPRPLV
jgi:hypothetical protein